jgi:hypothetical protein
MKFAPGMQSQRIEIEFLPCYDNVNASRVA